MVSKTIYCSNPLNKRNHDKFKKKLFKLFIKVTPEFFNKNSTKAPQLQLDTWICAGCRIAIDKLRASSPPTGPEVMEVDTDHRNDEDIQSMGEEAIHNEDPERNAAFELREEEPEAQLPLSPSTSSDRSSSAVSLSSIESAFGPEYNFTLSHEKLQLITNALGVRPFSSKLGKKETIKNTNCVIVKLSKLIRKVVGADFGSIVFKTNTSSCKYCIKLVDEMKERFADVCTKEDKYKLLTCLPEYLTIESVVSMFNCSQYMAREASKLRNSNGAYTFPIYRGREGLSEAVKHTVREFYLCTDNSRVNPAVRGTVIIRAHETGIRMPEAKRLIMMTLSDLYTEFCLKHPEIEISVSSFALLRPRQCIWQGIKGFQTTSTCTLHQNFELYMNACKVDVPLRDVLASIFCDTTSETCMLGLCSVCPNAAEIEKLFIYIADDEYVQYNFWGIIPEQYGMQMQTISKLREEFQQEVIETLPIIAAHHFLMKMQQNYYAYLKSDTIRNEASGIIQLDFAQNYAFLYPNEVQSFYYTNRQATLLPCVFSWHSSSCDEIKTKSYVVISDDLNHTATTVHAFIAHVLDKIKISHPKISKIYYISDGAASQFKNLKNFANLMQHKLDFKLDAEWHFTATSHGKSQCDAIGAVTKRSLRLASLKPARQGELQVTISSALDMFNHCNTNLASITLEYLLVTSEMIKNITLAHNLEERYAQASTISGTRSHHSFKPVSSNEIEIRRFSLSPRFSVVNINRVAAMVAEVVQYTPGKFVGIISGRSFLVGMVTDGDNNVSEYSIQIMQRVGKGNNFTWYEPPRIPTVIRADIIKIVEAPIPSSSTRPNYRLSKLDFDELKSFVKK